MVRVSDFAIIAAYQVNCMLLLYYLAVVPTDKGVGGHVEISWVNLN